jgi:hypothetical protein
MSNDRNVRQLFNDTSDWVSPVEGSERPEMGAFCEMAINAISSIGYELDVNMLEGSMSVMGGLYQAIFMELERNVAKGELTEQEALADADTIMSLIVSWLLKLNEALNPETKFKQSLFAQALTKMIEEEG